MVAIEEESRRFRIWAANLDMFIEHNSADLTSDEFPIKVHGHKRSCLKPKPLSEGEISVIGRIENKVMDKVKSFTAPDSIDWYVFLFLFLLLLGDHYTYCLLFFKYY